jgi:hypothetical protein
MIHPLKCIKQVNEKISQTPRYFINNAKNTPFLDQIWMKLREIAVKQCETKTENGVKGD